MITLIQHISNWVGFLFIVWFILKHTKYSKLSEYINPYYTIYFIFIGYILYILINLIKGVDFDLSYILLGFITHYIPIYLFNLTKSEKNEYSGIFFIIIMSLYLSYIQITTNKNIYQLYFIDPQVKTLDEFLLKFK